VCLLSVYCEVGVLVSCGSAVVVLFWTVMGGECSPICHAQWSNAQKSTSEHTYLPPIITGDFSTRSTAVCVHVVDKYLFCWRTSPMHRYTQQICMYSPQ
jgi:hypothetical protein